MKGKKLIIELIFIVISLLILTPALLTARSTVLNILGVLLVILNTYIFVDIIVGDQNRIDKE